MKYFGLLLFVISSTIVHAATVEPRYFFAPIPQAAADTDTTALPERKRSVSVGVSYGNDAIFFGRTSPVKYPFVTTDVVYNDKSGLFVYGSGLKVLGYEPIFDEVDIGGGYLFRLSKKYSGTISYTRFIFNTNAMIIKSAASNDINFKNTFNFKYFKASATADYLFGKASDVFVSTSISKYIEPNWRLFGENDYLTINPSANMIMGTQNFINKYSEDRFNRLKLYNIYGFYSSTMKRNNGRFAVLNYYLKVPVAYNTLHYTIEAAYRYSIPVNVENILMNGHASFFNLTFYYLFY